MRNLDSVVKPRNIHDARYLYLNAQEDLNKKDLANHYFNAWDRMALAAAKKMKTKEELEKLLHDCPFKGKSTTFVLNRLKSIT